ncbi:hypothetical protein M0R04_11255 [Candidatus Dojkabacteria bacterium]|jgi:hypothetical protein|nr:hypothetical protein [Candidatus Dojkabacteria bacterium]
MAHNVLKTVPTSSWWVPYGAENKVSVYVKDDTLGEYDLTPHMVSWDFDLVNNRIAVGTLHLYSITSEEQAYLDRMNRVKVFVGNTILHVFEIKKVAFDTTQGATITLEGIECKALRALTNRMTTTDYQDVLSETITTDLISGIFEQGTISSFGKVFFRAEFDKKLKCLMNQADYHRADWWITWSEASSYNTDYYNISQNRGSGTSLWTFTTDGEDQNIFLTSKAEDQSNIVNYVICIGAGNELTSINYHATTNRTYLNGGDTWLATAIDADDTTLTVNNTNGFPTAGTITLGTEQITYTGKTQSATTGTFTGCTRASGSTTAISHPVDTPIINRHTLIVDDASSFGDTGQVWVGSERIRYTSKTATTLVLGDTTYRGYYKDGTSGDTTPVYAHADNIEVWDAQYTPTSTQTGSSIDDNGLVEAKYDFRTIIDRNMLDVTAQAILAENRTLKENIVVIPINQFEWFDDKKLKLGDTVTLIDSSAALSGDYEIKRLHVFRNHGSQQSCEIELGKERVDYVKSIADAQIFTKDITSYAQGSPVIVSDSESDNCDTSVNLTDEFYGIDLDVIIPKNTIAVKNMNLNYTIGRYKVFASSTPSGGGDTTVSGGGSTTVSGGGSTSGTNYSLAGTSPTSHTSGGNTVTGVSVTGDGSTYDDLITGISLPQNETQDITINLTMWASANMSIVYLRLKDPSSNRYYPDATGLRTILRVASHTHTQGNDSGGSTEVTTDTANITKHASPTMIIPISWLDESSSNYKLQICTSTSGTVYYTYDIIENAAHSHTTPDHQHATPDHQHATPNHIHTITYGITSVASACSDIQVYIDGTEKTSAIESLYGTLSTSLMNEVNLADSSIFTFEAGKRYSIKVRPTGKCFIHAGVQGELFIKSTT